MSLIFIGSLLSGNFTGEFRLGVNTLGKFINERSLIERIFSGGWGEVCLSLEWLSPYEFCTVYEEKLCLIKFYKTYMFRNAARGMILCYAIDKN